MTSTLPKPCSSMAWVSIPLTPSSSGWPCSAATVLASRQTPRRRAAIFQAYRRWRRSSARNASADLICKDAFMTKYEIFQRLVNILVETFGIEAERIVPEARLRDDLDIDSIDAVDLMVQLKPLVGQRLQPEAFKLVRTVGDVVDALHRLTAGRETVNA